MEYYGILFWRMKNNMACQIFVLFLRWFLKLIEELLDCKMIIENILHTLHGKILK